MSRDEARLTLLQASHFSVLDKALVVKCVTIDDFKSFVCKFKASLRLKGLVQGNYSKEQALEVARNLQNMLQPVPPLEWSFPPIRIRQVPSGDHYCRLASFNPTDTNSVVVNHYQVGPSNLHKSAVVKMLVVSFVAYLLNMYYCLDYYQIFIIWQFFGLQNLMKEPAFDILRTKEKLGYSVGTNLRNTCGVLDVAIKVNFQSDKFR